MKNIIIASVMMLCYNYTAMAQKTVTIKGNVIGDLKGYTKIYAYSNAQDRDSTVIINGNFEITIPFENSFKVIIYDEYTLKVKGFYGTVPLQIDSPGTLYIKDIDINSGLSSGILSGMKSAIDFKDYIRQIREIDAEINQVLQKKYGSQKTMKAITIGGKSAGKVADEESDNLEVDRQALVNEKYALFLEQFVKNHYGDPLSVTRLSGNVTKLNPADLERIYKLLSLDMQRSENGQRIVTYLDGLKNSATGQHVKEFVLYTPEGKSLSFSTLRGKYVLIDFWASWCGPCRRSFPYMKALYRRYKGKNFEIYSISTDRSRSEWLKALKDEHLPWLQSLDTKEISDRNFAVTAIPTIYLVDPQGKIIMKEIDFEPNGAMEKKLAELLGNKGISGATKTVSSNE